MIKKEVAVLRVIVLMVMGCLSYSPFEIDEVTIPNTEDQILNSSTNGQSYQIYIALPQEYDAEISKSYPVIYVLDGNAWFGVTTTITRMMAFGNELSDVIVVGIGYSTDSIDEILKFREMDFTPTQINENTGGAEQFLRFLEKDLISYVDSNYRTKEDDRTLVGKSHGGLFALYSLFQAPGIFSRYVVISPTLWWDDRIIFEYEEAFAATHTDMPIDIFLAVGSEEPESKYRMISNLRELQTKLEGRQNERIEIDMVVMENETHSSITAGAISKGIRTVFQ